MEGRSTSRSRAARYGQLRQYRKGKRQYHDRSVDGNCQYDTAENVYLGATEQTFVIKESGEFVLNLTTSSLIKSADYCGIYTGAKVNKFEKCRLTAEKASEVECPIIAESPLSIECRVTDIIPMGTHDMFLADIVAVDVDESIIDEKGKLRLDKAKLAAFAHGEYYELGRKLGEFGFSARKKQNKKGLKERKR